jgi:Holliday junction resolvase RusA-like endonuclease
MSVRPTINRRLVVRFTIPIEPMGKGTARAGLIWKKGADGKSRPVTRKTKTGRDVPIINVAADVKTVKWEQQVRLFAASAMGDRQPIQGPVGLVIRCYLKRQTALTWKSKPMPACFADQKRPDLSNILKAVEDGMTGVAFVDDRQVVLGIQEKWYTAGPGFGDIRPRVEVSLYEVWCA